MIGVSIGGQAPDEGEEDIDDEQSGNYDDGVDHDDNQSMKGVMVTFIMGPDDDNIDDNHDDIRVNNYDGDDKDIDRQSPGTVQTGVGPDQIPSLHFSLEFPTRWNPLSQCT